MQRKCLIVRALAGGEKILVREHSETLLIVPTLGLLYFGQSRLDDAAKMFDRTLSGREKTSGPEHSDTLQPVGYLGALYLQQGCLDDAEKMLIRYD
jgi:hypothetical protein